MSLNIFNYLTTYSFIYCLIIFIYFLCSLAYFCLLFAQLASYFFPLLVFLWARFLVFWILFRIDHLSLFRSCSLLLLFWFFKHSLESSYDSSFFIIHFCNSLNLVLQYHLLSINAWDFTWWFHGSRFVRPLGIQDISWITFFYNFFLLQ